MIAFTLFGKQFETVTDVFRYVSELSKEEMRRVVESKDVCHQISELIKNNPKEYQEFLEELKSGESRHKAVE